MAADYASQKTALRSALHAPGRSRQCLRAYRRGPFLVAKEVLPAVRQRGSGSFFFSNNSSSLRGRKRLTGQSLYYPRVMMRTLAQVLTEEYSEYSVHVANVVIDGTIDSPRDLLDARSPKARILERTNGLGAELVLEAAGTPSSLETAVAVARKGGKIVILGVFHEEVALNVRMVQLMEKQLLGSLIYQRQDFADAIQILAGGGIDKGRHITAEIPLHDSVSHGFVPLCEQRAAHTKIQVYPHAWGSPRPARLATPICLTRQYQSGQRHRCQSNGTDYGPLRKRTSRRSPAPTRPGGGEDPVPSCLRPGE